MENKSAFYYKIICCDENITDFYIGSSVNMIRRKSRHKSNCNNITEINYNINLYKFIREHGGFSNWKFIVFDVKLIACDNIPQFRRIKEEYEQEYINLYKPTLNTKRSFITPEFQKQLTKIYNQKNAEYIAKRQKKYNEINKEQIAVQTHNYYEKNKENIKQKHKENYYNNPVKIEKDKIKAEYNSKENKLMRRRLYYEKNKEHIRELQNNLLTQEKVEMYAKPAKEIITCGCGSQITKGSKSRHESSSKKHQDYLLK